MSSHLPTPSIAGPSAAPSPAAVTGRARLALACLALWALLVTGVSAAQDLTFFEQSVPLPGAPAALVPADLDGDGLQDLAVVLAYTEWDQIGIGEMAEMDEVEGLVEVLTIVPVLFDRREVRAFLGRPEGGFAAAGGPLELPLSVLALEAGPPGSALLPALALTDTGASVLRFEREEGDAGRLVLEPLVEEPTVLAGTGVFFSRLDLLQDWTGDGRPDLLLPAEDGLALYPGEGDGARATLSREAMARIPPPEAPGRSLERGRSRLYPLPRSVDLDGDRLPDLLYRLVGRDGEPVYLARRGIGSAPGGVERFGEPTELATGEDESEAEDGEGRAGVEGGRDDGPGPPDLVQVLRLRPDGPASAVYLSTEELDGDAGLREGLRQAREPDYRVEEHPLAPFERDLSPAREPAALTPVVGYVFGDQEADLPLPGGFQDLDGDGRQDLVTVTNDITLLKALAVLATRRLTLDLGFHTWCQQADGTFRKSAGEVLESRLKIDLDDLQLSRRSLFDSDFDGDGRADFVQLGRSREIGIHRGRAGCAYRERPDTRLRLRDELRDLALVRALDLDGDGRSDLAVTHPRNPDEAEPGVTPPVRLDLYLSRGGAR